MSSNPYLQFIKDSPSMADTFVAAYKAWADSHSQAGFFDWSGSFGLIGDGPNQFLCLCNWDIRPCPDKSILNYAVIDFEDGSIAVRRNHQPDANWLTANHRKPEQPAYLPSEIQRLTEQRDTLLAALKEYIDAADESVRGEDDVAAMLRFGEADKAAREAIQNSGGAR